MTDLDKSHLFRETDPHDMLARISELPQQCRDAWANAQSLELPAEYRQAEAVVILGMGGPDATGVAGWLAKGIEPKQIAAAEKFEQCEAVLTRHFQRHKPGRQKSHWHNSAESYCLVGDAAAKAMLKKKPETSIPSKTFLKFENHFMISIHRN